MTATVLRRTPSRAERVNAGEWLVWLTMFMLLGAGLILRGQVENRTVNFGQDGVSLAYPVNWTLLSDEDDFQVFHVIDPASSIQFPTSVRVRRIPFGELGRAASSLGDVALSWSARQGQTILVYSVLQIVQTEARGRPAIAIDYAYVPEPAMGAAAGSIPSVVRARDILVQQGDTIIVLTFEADTDIYQQELIRLEKILASFDVK
jgi:hypothetical protein